MRGHFELPNATQANSLCKYARRIVLMHAAGEGIESCSAIVCYDLQIRHLTVKNFRKTGFKHLCYGFVA